MSSYYEKIGNETRCIDEEIPFEVPGSWEWVRFSNVVSYNMGKTPERNNSKYWNNGQIPWISIADMKHKSILTETKENVSQVAFNERFNKHIVPVGTLIMSFKLTIGKVAILGINALHNEAIISILPYHNDDNVFRDFLYHAISELVGFISSTDAIKGATLNSSKLNNLLIPIPPILEQKRIIHKIQQLEKVIPIYEKLEQEETELTNKLPDNLKKSILQYAIQGKLVAQSPDDEPASALLDNIRKEKAQLIKAGKLKRDKTESFIYRDTTDNSYYEKIGGEIRCIDEEVPFEIPENWEWIRLKNVVQINPTNKADENINASFVTMKDIEAGYSNSFKFEKKEWGKIKKGFTHFQNGDVAFAKITPCFQNRKSLIFTGLINNVGAGTTELHVLRPISEYINPFYLLIFVKTEYFIKYGITNFTGTAGQQRFPTDKLKDVLIPLPPSKEQQRITEKIKQIFTVIV